MVTQTRKDALPEHVKYRDVGCDLHPHCLTCPLPVCKEELLQGAQTVRAHMRILQINLFRSEGYSVRWIAQVMGLTPRSVYKSVALGKRNELASLTDRDRHATISIAAHSVSGNGRSHAR